MNCNTTHYRANSSSVPGDPTGFTDTDLVAGAIANIQAKTGRSEDEAKAELAKLNPSGRLIAPAEIAALVLELILSDRNGEALEIA